MNSPWMWRHWLILSTQVSRVPWKSRSSLQLSQLAHVESRAWNYPQENRALLTFLLASRREAFSAWQRGKQKPRLKVDCVSEVLTLKERKPYGDYFIIQLKASGGFKLKGILSTTSLSPFLLLFSFPSPFPLFKVYKLCDLVVEIP